MKTYYIVTREGSPDIFDDAAASKAAGVPSKGLYGTFRMADQMRRALESTTGVKLAVGTWSGVHPETVKTGHYFASRRIKRSTA